MVVFPFYGKSPLGLLQPAMAGFPTAAGSAAAQRTAAGPAPRTSAASEGLGRFSKRWGMNVLNNEDLTY